MKTYWVSAAYIGYVSQEVQAESEEEAVKMVEDLGIRSVDDFSRFSEYDLIEEVTDELEADSAAE